MAVISPLELLEAQRCHKRRVSVERLSPASPLCDVFTLPGVWDAVVSPYLDKTDLLRLASTSHSLTPCRVVLRSIHLTSPQQLEGLADHPLTTFFPSLEHLSIISSKHASHEAVARLAATLRSSPARHMTRLEMKGPMLVDELLVAVTQCLGGLEELETLRLGGNLFTESVGLLARSLVDGQCRKLSCLDLSNSARAPAGALAELLGALRGHGRRPIETLVLTCTPLRPLGYHRLCSQGPRWEGLRHLYLGQTWPEASGLSLLCQALSDDHFPALETLDLTYTGLCPATLLQLSRSLSSSVRLSVLVLDCNASLGQGPLEVAALILAVREAITRLDLRACGLGRGQSDKVCAALEGPRRHQEEQEGSYLLPCLQSINLSYNGLDAQAEQRFRRCLMGPEEEEEDEEEEDKARTADRTSV